MRRLSVIGLLTLTLVLMISPARADGWTAEIVTKLDLTAGPGKTAAFLAPDGSRFAYFKGDDLCIYSIEGEQGDCVGLDRGIGIDFESVRWSPDSTKLAFSENFLITFRDSDIWVYDTEANELTDLTPMPNRELKLFGNEDPNVIFTVDLSPQWSPDSESVYFIRYQFNKAADAIAKFNRVSAEGGEAEEIGATASSGRVSTYGFAVSADEQRIVYNIDTQGKEKDGTWFLDVETGESKFAAAAIQGTLPWAYEFSPGGDLVLVVGMSREFMNGGLQTSAEESAIYTLPVYGGRQQQLDTDIFVYSGGWGLEGSTLAYTTYDREHQDEQGLYITSAPGEKGELVLAGRFIPSTPTQRTPLTWGANNTMLLTDIEDYKLVVVQLSAG